MARPRFLVLGASGFVGQHLCERLSASGASVRAFSRTLPTGLSLGAHSDIQWIRGNFHDSRDLRSALAGCDVVYHLVSTTTPASSNHSPENDARDNIIGTIQLLEAMRDLGIAKIVFVSTGGAIYGETKRVPIDETVATDPISAYGISKLAIEKYLALYQRLFKLSYCVLRVANVFGERQPLHRSLGAVGIFLDKALRGETIEIWGDGEAVRDYVHVEDVVRALEIAAGHEGPCRIFNIGSGRGISINELLRKIEIVIGSPVQRRYVPARTADVSVSVLDIARARQMLGWAPRVQMDEGLRRVVAWMRNEQVLTRAA